MTRDEYVDALAREVSEDFGTDAAAKNAVNATLRAISALAERGGPKLVERELTPHAEIGEDVWPIRNIYGELDRTDCMDAKQSVWRAMFDTAPAVPGDDA